MASQEQQVGSASTLEWEDILSTRENDRDPFPGGAFESPRSLSSAMTGPPAPQVLASEVASASAPTQEELSHKELLKRQLECYETALTIESSMYHALSRATAEEADAVTNKNAAATHSWWYWFLDERKNYVMDYLETCR
eukprot:gb/GECG01008068.1/.p1 GENE.gb/GECG01008068.1/~~gb/GECG01008068.1/.p1  ORF type:complete len:139 (+),score=22.05 gb/GECG01008068.1/:1-417(+)